MRPSARVVFIVLGVLAISFAIFTFYIRFTAQRKALYYHFDGKVDTINYNKNGQPTVTIRGIKYDLSVTRWNFDRQIQAGDSMVKKMDSMAIKIFKADGTVIIKQ
jgi:hypothetical protein